MRTALIVGLVCVAGAASAKDASRDEIAELVAQQIDGANIHADAADAKAPYADGVKIVITDPDTSRSQVDPTEIRLDHMQGHADKHLDVQLSRDGKTAWASVETEVAFAADGHDPDTHEAIPMRWTASYRISDVIAKVGDHWKIVASAWSAGVDNAKANKEAQTKHPPTLAPLVGGKPDPSLAGELIAWKGGGKDTAIAKTAIVFGSAPGERTTDGPGFRKAWYATWVNHVGLEPKMLAALAPSGTTGWVISDVTLEKKGYKIAFRIFAVFDKTSDGKWQLVHAHLATPGWGV